jgi:adenosylmethionine-8-amino-7-oxononanoate aminotransferase
VSLAEPDGIVHPSYGRTPLGSLRADAAKRHLWGHFTRQQAWAGGSVPTVVRGEGAYVWDSAGRRILDGLSGLFVVQAGHGRAELAEAAARQARQLAFFPIWGYAHPPAIDLAERLADLAGGDLGRVFFTTGGGEAVETAWKLAKQYWAACGKPSKRRVLSRAGAYHGTTHGALALTQIAPYQEPFAPLTPGAAAVGGINFYRSERRYWDDPEGFGAQAAASLEEAIVAAGPDNVAAFFVEPVQNSGGCFTPPPGYFARVQEICQRHDVLLVSDEVICAYGRTGGWFAHQDLGYQPDIVTSSKGLTSGYSPLGAVLASERVFEPFREGDLVFRHGFTFGGHPVSAAVALANLDLFEAEGLIDRVRRLSPQFRERLEALKSIRLVGDVRGAGYFFGIELTRDPVTRQRFTDEEAGRIRAFLGPALYQAGLYARADDRGDVVIQLAPPLTSGLKEFDEIAEILAAVLSQIEANL